MRAKTAVLILILVGLMLYGLSLGNSFVGDDFEQIVRNPKVFSLASIPSFFSGSTYYGGGGASLIGLYYRPIMLSAFTIITSIFGLNPSIFHIIQLLIHLVNAVLIFLLLRKFFGNNLAFISSLIFTVHPLNSETVLYIANLQEVLFMFFGLSALLLIINYPKKLGQFTFIALISLLFLLCFFSKETGILFLIVSSLYTFLFHKKNTLTVLGAGIFSLIVYLYFRFGIAHMHLAHHSVAPISTASLPHRLIHAPAIIMHYLITFFYPAHLLVAYTWFIKTISLTNFVLPLIGVCGIFGGLIYITSKLKHKNPQEYRVFIFFLTWLIVGFGMHIQILPLDMTTADRWFYFPIVGLLGIGCGLAQYFRIQSSRTLYIVVAVCILLFSVRTFIRSFDWKDDYTINAHDIQYAPNDFFLQNGLSTELIKRGEYDKARPYALAAYQQYPYYATMNNMAIIYTAEHDYPKAKTFLQMALQNDSNYHLYENYANFLQVYDSTPEADIFTDKALQRYPNNAVLWRIKGEIADKLGTPEAAIKALQKSQEIQPDEHTNELIQKIKNQPTPTPEP